MSRFLNGQRIMGTATIASIHKPEEKKFVRRSSSDCLQTIRRIVQWLFVALNGWLGVQFLLWVHYYESGGVGLNMSRPAGFFELHHFSVR